MSTIVFQIQSFLIVAVFFYGIAKRSNRRLHVKVMMTGIIWDILLILQIELSRHAIDKASRVATNPMMLNIHVSLAILSVLLYGAMFYTGKKLLSGNNSIRPKHKALGFTTIVMRTLVLITSFWAVS